MFTTLRRMVRRGPCAPRRAGRGASDETDRSDQEKILKLLRDAEPGGRVYQLRDLHKETDLPQSQALRAVAELENRQLVTLHGGHFDPLSALVKLAKTKK